LGTTAARYLIVNADDFGQSHAINRGVIEAIERGIVTSASLMVRWPAVEEAAEFAAAHPELSLGLHVDLGEWAHRCGMWEPLYEVVSVDDAEAVSSEVERQLTLFRRATGCDPTHLDSHQHVHLHEPARSAIWSVARRLGIPTRHFAPKIRYCGSFYGQTSDGAQYLDGINFKQLIEILETLPPGITELGCHPGEAGVPGSMYSSERRVEVAVLCDPRVKSAISDLGIQLISFHDSPHLPGTG
jgi:chitin disaccharide deacetylase